MNVDFDECGFWWMWILMNVDFDECGFWWMWILMNVDFDECGFWWKIFWRKWFWWTCTLICSNSSNGVDVGSTPTCAKSLQIVQLLLDFFRTPHFGSPVFVDLGYPLSCPLGERGLPVAKDFLRVLQSSLQYCLQTSEPSKSLTAEFLSIPPGGHFLCLDPRVQQEPPMSPPNCAPSSECTSNTSTCTHLHLHLYHRVWTYSD